MELCASRHWAMLWKMFQNQWQVEQLFLITRWVLEGSFPLEWAARQRGPCTLGYQAFAWLEASVKEGVLLVEWQVAAFF